ncbi:hypothetical protein [Gracilimonas mengyeensis]|uniref:Cytochrome C and Quinol oxidase polypeptide I n=1 Tax=Gracilimonas mengyeensis TaxID=1302730 RepID=A0A521C5G6_9BACT|nr:hypothetical protein [Gracilimonas mengyeensis]SMO54658.1 hypothetical protein SAMN06265219_104181 [Gracilimonas mengyeensis]
MPLITRLFIKTGLVYFVISLLIGISSQIPSLHFPAITPLFWHMLMLGWITQIIIGVSLWMFPGRKKEESFQNQRLGWIAYAGLNSGLFLRVISEPLIYAYPNTIWGELLVVSAVLHFVGIGSYVLEIWPRVMSRKQRLNRRKKRK